MKNYQSIIALGACAAIVLAGASYASADKMKADKVGSGLEMHINNNGSVIVRGAEVTSVSDTRLIATTEWGNSEIEWRLETDNSTNYVGKNSKAIDEDDIEVGDYISFSGKLLASSSAFTVDADIVRNWSHMMEAKMEGKKMFQGEVKNLNESNGDFDLVLQNGTVVEVDGSVALLMNLDLDNGDMVRVNGNYNAETEVMVASSLSLDLRDKDDKPGNGPTNDKVKEKIDGFWKKINNRIFGR